MLGGHGDKIYIVTELLRGGSLINELTNYDEGFPEADARIIFRGLLDGVAYLHLKGVIHRDLKVCALSCCLLMEGLSSSLAAPGIAAIATSCRIRAPSVGMAFTSGEIELCLRVMPCLPPSSPI
jgi:serine/threonine protein kinase